MFFRWIDKKIDAKVAVLFSFFRKMGRRSERVYYTAYKDWLVYISRRSKDMAVKISLGAITVSLVYTTNSLKRIFNDNFEYYGSSISDMENTLKNYHAKGLKSDDISPQVENIRLGRDDLLVIREFEEQRDK
ncbi:hypothetical protein SteCoe_37687 [Stentor coeruleus]|uniref:Uncharacterized protein n=1 Tax=Stentor coeruleus TaxID=5963 RepID=A0A1R2AML7_9CILI|nr:hypothetical protein SteCoe_37687 [Stentor coeruleus]